MARKPDLPCAQCGRLLWRGRTSLPEGQATCRPCRASIPKSPRRYHGECSTDGCDRPVLGRGLCATHYSYWHRSQKKYTVICEACGATSTAGRDGQRYCSLRCVARAKADAAAEVQRRRRLPVRYTGPRHHAPLTIHVKTRNRLTSGQCRVCEQWFVSQHFDVTCSAECRTIRNAERRRTDRERRRATKRNAYRADVHRAKVYASDGYRCHLCGKKTDPTKSVPHPKAPTIDHVIPLAAGGTHEPDNCRTACFLCNATKGDRGGGEQLLLLAI